MHNRALVDEGLEVDPAVALLLWGSHLDDDFQMYPGTPMSTSATGTGAIVPP